MTLYGPDGNQRVDAGPTMTCEEHGNMPLGGAQVQQEGKVGLVPFCPMCEIQWKFENFPVVVDEA
jgi:hypothetical protein